MRQAGLSQIPLSMGTPVQQAGLAPPQMPGQTAAASVAGVAPVAVTMADRSAIVADLAARGMSFPQIQAELAAMGLIAPQETPEEIVETAPAGIGDVLRQGARQQLGMGLSGAGTIAERMFGREGAQGDAMEAADAAFGLTPEEQAARAARAEGQTIVGEIGDAAVGSLPFTGAMLAGGVVGGWLGGVAGSAFGPVGTVAGATGGRKLGAWVGTLLPAIPTMVGSALERAKENGHNIDDPEVQSTVIATGAARAVLETFGIERLGSILLGPASNAAKRSLAKAAARGGGQLAAVEAAAEAAGEILEIAIFDPNVRELLREGEYAKLMEYAQEKYARDILIGSAASAVMGGGLGGAGTTWQQNKTNAQRTQDVETLAGVAEEGGVSREQLEAAAQDPAQVPALAQAARELGQARRDIQQAQTVLDAVAENPDPELRAQAEARYTEVVTKADEVYDRVMKPFGALTSGQIEAKKEQAAQRAREVLVEKDVATPEAVAKLDRQTVGGFAATLANAESRLEAANEKLRSGEMYDSTKREAAQKEYLEAQNALQKTKDDIAIRTGKATPESIKADAKARQDKADYDAAVDRQFTRKFEPLMARDPEAAAVEAERIIEANKSDADKGLNTAIRKLETRLDKATSVPEIEKLEAEIADKRSRLGRQPPIVAAARRVLDSVGPRQGDAQAQGSSPASARQTPAPTATTATATPAATATAPASAPQPAQGSPAAPAATPQAATPAAPPAGAATTPTAPPPQETAALDRLRNANQQKLVGSPEDAITAAPTILDMGAQERQRLGLPADATPTEVYAAGASREILGFERDLQMALGLPIDATPSQMRKATAEIDALFKPAPDAASATATPASAPATTPDTETANPPTREQARQQAEAEAAAAATQARVDRAYQTGPAPTFDTAKRTAPTSKYVDMLDVFGRRTATMSQARDWVREQGAKTGYEYYVAFDRETGEVLGAGTKNHPNSVGLSNATVEAMAAGRNVDLVHNHPQGTTLSHTDMALLYSYPGNNRVVAVAPDGSSYTAEATDAGRKTFGDRASSLLKALTTFTVTGRNTYADQLFNATANAWVREGVVQPTQAGTVSQQDANAIGRGVRRAINRALAQEGLMRYTEAGPRETVTSREQAAYDRGVSYARKAIRERFALSGARGARADGARSGNVQRSGGIRSGRSRAARNQGGDQGGTGSGLAEPDGLSADGDADAGRASGRAGRYALAATQPLPGAPTIQGASGPDAALVSVADAYARDNGIDLRRQAEFVEVDPERARRIADAYEAMPHAPNDPRVREAYQDLIRQTVAQYRALERAGYQFYFFNPEGADPYAGQPGGFGNPWNAMRDLRANKRMAVYPTSDGFGTSDADISGNPLLVSTDIQWARGSPDGPLTPVTANDLFRAVHDAFGHGLEGAGFRARGEENAWQAHVRLFTGPAVAAITSETRGQNSWLNYGPHGETNRTAAVEDTVFADQKTGLMPEWTWQEGRAADMDGLAETPELPAIEPAKVRRGQGAGRQFPTWYDFSAQLPDTVTPDEAAAEVSRRGADGKEHAIVARTGDGAVLSGGTNRASNAVASSDAAIEYFRNDIAPVTMTHNHPIPSPLSWGDMQMMFGSASDLTMVAVLPDGAREQAALTPAARAMPFRDRMDMLHRAENKVYSHLNSARGYAGVEGAITRASALNRALAQAGAIVYTPGLPDPTDPRAKEAIDAAVEDITDTYPSLRDARDDGRPGEQGRSPADDTAAIGSEAIRSIRSASDRAIADAGSRREITGKADLTQQPDAIVAGLEEAADIPGLSPAAQQAMRDMADRLKTNREAFKVSRPDLSPMVMDRDGNPLVVFHGTNAAGFTEFNTFDGSSPIFTGFNPDTAVTYSREFKRELTDKLARFRTEPATVEDTLTSEDVAREFQVDIRVGGNIVNPQYIYGRVPDGSPWRDILFPTGEPSAMSSATVALTPEQLTAMQSELGLTDADMADMNPEPWFDARYKSDARLRPQGQPLLNVPYPTARDIVRRLITDRMTYRIASDAMSTEPGAYMRGDIYPLFVDMVNPLVVDYKGRDWDDAPHTYAMAMIDIPDGTDPGGAALYRVNRQRFDFDIYGGEAEARAAAEQWLAEKQTPGARRAEIWTAADIRVTDAWAKHAHQQGHDGVIFKNIRDSGSIIAPVDDVYVVFNPQQLKHALDNDGTFSRNEPDILEENQSVPQLAQAVRNFQHSQQTAKKVLQPPAWMDVKTQQGSAIKAAIDIARTPGVITRFASFVETQLINQLAPIRNYELGKKGQLDIGMDSMFKAAEIAVNDPGRNEALLYYGAAKLGPNGEFRVAEGTIGLHTMLKKLPNGEAVLDWMEYMGAKRAQEIRAKGLETPLSDEAIAAGLAKETPLFKEVAADWKKFNDANVDFLVDTGRISRALATTLKQDAAYIPFYRSEETIQGVHDLMDEAGIQKAAFSRRGGAVLQRDPGIKKLTGGKTRQVNNLIENMIRNSQAMIGAGMRNMAANKSFDLLSAAGDVSLQPARRRTDDGSYVNVTAPKHAVRMWKNGGEYYVIPETTEAVPVLIALAGMTPQTLGGIHGAMAAIGSFFRQSITLSPAFIVRNMIRDVISTGVLFQGKNLTMENNALKGFMSSLRHSASRQAFTAQTGMGDFRFGGTDIGLGKNDLLIELGVMKPTKLGQLGYQFRRAVNALEEVGTASELANRIAVYDALVNSGVRPDEAAYQALTITNYSRRGANSQLQMLLPLVPFLNARIQGLSRIWEDAVSKRGADRNQALMKLATSGALLTVASAALWGWNHSDEERRKEYEAEPLHRRLNYHIIYAGDRKVMIPKAFEVGTIFSTVPELAMQAAIAGDTSELGSATIMTLVNTFSFNPIPQAIMPALEVLTDYNFFTGRPIEGQRLTSMLREDRISPQTSSLAVALAKSGLGSFAGLSPVQMDHLLAGYGGVAYTSLATSIDVAAGELGILPARPTGVFGDIPVVNTALENTFRSMFKQRDADPANRWVEDFYQTRAAITQIYRSARAAALTGDVERARQLLAAAPATPAAYKLVNRAGAQLSDINSAIRQVQADPKMSGAEKRRKLDVLIKTRNDISAEVARIIRAAEEKQGTSFRRVAA